MPIYNFKCPNGHLKRDQYFSLNTLPQHLKCACGARMEQDYSEHIVGYSDSGYPYTDPQTGLTYTSANDKKQKLKVLGLEEAGWKEKGMSLSEHHKHEAWKQEKEGEKLLGNSYWMDDSTSFEKQAEAILKKDGDKIVQEALTKG